MNDDRSREKALFIIVLAVLLLLTVIFLRFLVEAEDRPGADIFRMFTLILLGLSAVCVYEFIRLSRISTR